MKQSQQPSQPSTFRLLGSEWKPSASNPFLMSRFRFPWYSIGSGWTFIIVSTRVKLASRSSRPKSQPQSRCHSRRTSSGVRKQIAELTKPVPPTHLACIVGIATLPRDARSPASR